MITRLRMLGIVILFLSAYPMPVLATTESEVSLICPVDGTGFNAQEVMSTTYSGEFDSDLLQLTVGFNPMIFFPWTCPTCYFTGYSDDFKRAGEKKSDGPKLTAKQKKGYISTLKPASLFKKPKDSRDFPSWVRYDLYAQRLKIEGAPSYEIGNALHNTAKIIRLTAAFPPIEKKSLDKINELLMKMPSKKDKTIPDWLKTAQDTEEILKKGKANNTDLLALLIYQYHLHGELQAVLSHTAKLQGMENVPEGIKNWANETEKLIYRELSFLQQALPYYEESVKKNIENAFIVRHLIGDTYHKLGDTKKMEEWFNTIKDVPKEAEDGLNKFINMSRAMEDRFPLSDSIINLGEATTKVNLAIIRSAISIYYADNEGRFPKNMELLLWRYLGAIPPIVLRRYGHAVSSAIESRTFSDKQGKVDPAPLQDTGHWLYDPKSGNIIIDCTHKDSKGQSVYSW